MNLDVIFENFKIKIFVILTDKGVGTEEGMVIFSFGFWGIFVIL